MSLPLFFHENIPDKSDRVTLDEEASKHIVQVLRMRLGEKLELTNGKGALLSVVVAKVDKRQCEVTVESSTFTSQSKRKITIAISILKNSGRFEWFLEKATELGVAEIVPLICARTERQHFRAERMRGILVSAILQSHQPWLPELREPVVFQEFLKKDFEHKTKYERRFIAHCLDDEKNSLGAPDIADSFNSIILIGPEGDFTRDEIKIAMEMGFMPVSLGDTRLRTETAGIVAAALLKISCT